jgi:hypothetical protein
MAGNRTETCNRSWILIMYKDWAVNEKIDIIAFLYNFTTGCINLCLVCLLAMGPLSLMKVTARNILTVLRICLLSADKRNSY